MKEALLSSLCVGACAGLEMVGVEGCGGLGFVCCVCMCVGGEIVVAAIPRF